MYCFNVFGFVYRVQQGKEKFASDWDVYNVDATAGEIPAPEYSPPDPSTKTLAETTAPVLFIAFHLTADTLFYASFLLFIQDSQSFCFWNRPQFLTSYTIENQYSSRSIRENDHFNVYSNKIMYG